MTAANDRNEGGPQPVGIDFDIASLSPDKKLNELLRSVIVNVKLYADDQIRHIKQLTQIGLALSGEKDIDKLLELIVEEAKELANADAGTLYILDKDREKLQFAIVQTDSMDTRMGGTSGIDITFPDVPLYVDDKPNHTNVSSHVALTDQIVNIPDVYEAEGFDFSGARNYDQSSGYRSKSMLVIPMKNHENEPIGVLQLLNAQDPETGEILPFSTEYVDLIASLASQAAVALTNRQLIEDLINLLNSFITSIAIAIDEKSPYTGGHITRVVDLTMMIAGEICKETGGPFKDVNLSGEEMEELRMAAWMHDVGKITTPEHVVDKQTKLETIFDRIHFVGNRFALIRKSIENSYLKDKVELLRKGPIGEETEKAMDDQLRSELDILREDEELIRACNAAGEFMSDDKIERVKDIASKSFLLNGETTPYITEDETQNLCIRKGSLTTDERGIIENHAKMTREILSQLPFPQNLANVPLYAGSHHEKLDGSGYPYHLDKESLPLQARILVIADVFEALTAKDRPYKEPMSLSQAVKIMGFMKMDKHIDPDIYDLFISNRLYIDYAKKEMNPEQIDIPEAMGEDTA